MAKYEVVEKSFVNGKLVRPGAVVDINDDPAKGGMKPGANLKPFKGGTPAPAGDGK